LAASDNKAYTRRSEYLAWPAAHLPLNRGKNCLNSVDLFCTKLSVKLGKRRVSTTLAETAKKLKAARPVPVKKT